MLGAVPSHLIGAVLVANCPPLSPCVCVSGLCCDGLQSWSQSREGYRGYLSNAVLYSNGRTWICARSFALWQCCRRSRLLSEHWIAAKFHFSLTQFPVYLVSPLHHWILPTQAVASHQRIASSVSFCFPVSIQNARGFKYDPFWPIRSRWACNLKIG